MRLHVRLHACVTSGQLSDLSVLLQNFRLSRSGVGFFPLADNSSDTKIPRKYMVTGSHSLDVCKLYLIYENTKRYFQMIYKLANTFLELQPLLPPIIKYLKKNGMNQINPWL